MPRIGSHYSCLPVTFIYFVLKQDGNYYPQVCGDVINSLLDDKLPLANLWLVLVEAILSKKRIQNYSFFFIQGK